MATTHKTVIQAGGGDYTSIAAAIAGSGDGSAGDFSTLTVDSATYTETVTIPGSMFLRIQTVPLCAPVIQSATTPITHAAGVGQVQIVGANATSRVTLKTTAGTAQSLFATSSPFRLAFCTLDAGNSGSVAIGGNGTAWTDALAWSIEDCVAQGTFASFITGATAGVATLARSVFGGTYANGMLKVARIALGMSRCKVSGTGALLVASAGAGIGVVPIAKWTFADCEFIANGAPPSAGEPYIPLYEAPGSVNASADLRGCMFYQAGSAGTSKAVELGGATTGVTMKNCGYRGWGTALRSVNDAFTAQNCGFHENGTNAGTHITLAGEQTADPLQVSPSTGNFDIPANSPWLGAGTTTPSTVDYLGRTRPTPSSIGSRDPDVVVPNLTGATSASNIAVAAVFSEAVAGSDLLTAGAWLLTPLVGGIAAAVASVTCADGINAAVAVSSMTPGASYRLTCPATLRDVSGNLIGTVAATFTAGAAVPLPLAVSGAYWESDRVLVLSFAAAVRQVSAYNADDALNPANYTATRADGKEAPFALAVESVDASTVRSFWTGPLGMSNRTGTIEVAATVKSAAGVLIAAPFAVTLAGVVAAPPARPGDAELGFRDVLENAAAGAGGDYVLGTSAETLQKMAIRIMSTALASWVYAPGLGIATKLKRLMRDHEIDAFVRDVRTRCAALPDVVAVKVTAEQTGDGVFKAFAQLQTKSLGPVDAYWPGSGPGGIQ